MTYILLPALITLVILAVIKYTASQKSKPNPVELKYFGQVDFNKTEEYYDVPATINDTPISLDLNFNEERIPLQYINPTVDFINQIEKLEKDASERIILNFNSNKLVKEYIEHHLEEFNDEELKVLQIDQTLSLDEQKIQMLQKVHLKRIGLYPEEPESFGTFDYTINDDLTQYLIVVRFDNQGNITSLEMES